MDRRIQHALDGELAPGGLTSDTATDLARTQAALDRVVAAIPDDPLPDLSAAVLRRIRSTRNHRPATRTAGGRAGSALSWLWTPRPLQWRPAYAVAAAAAVLLAVAGLSAGRDGTSAAIAPPAAAAQVFVQFRLEAPDASAVSLAGDFTQWRPAYVLSRSASGVWTVVVPVEPGVHEYAFIVDGTHWVPDPYAPAVSDGFGGANSRLAILTPDSPRPM